MEAKNAVYADREPVIVTIPADAENGVKAAILLKIGDGTTVFNDLPYITALAGDVPEPFSSNRYHLQQTHSHQ